MRVMDLPGWPPSHFAVIGTGRGDTVPTHPDQVTIGDIIQIIDGCVRFNCDFEGKNAVCSFFTPDVEMAKTIA